MKSGHIPQVMNRQMMISHRHSGARAPRDTPQDDAPTNGASPRAMGWQDYLSSRDSNVTRYSWSAVFVLVAIYAQNSDARVTVVNGVKSEFPKGHIALKSLNAEVFDEAGNPVSLQETYLHHWILARYYLRVNYQDPKYESNSGIQQSDYITARNARYTVFMLMVWKYRRSLYNVGQDEYGHPLKPNYVGGLNCCYDGVQCKVKNALESVKRNVYLKYTVEWVDWSNSVAPVKVFILDIEFDVEQSTTGIANNNNYASTIKSSMSFPAGGDVVYGVAHQHSGGIGSTLYGEQKRLKLYSRTDGLFAHLNLYIGQGNSVGDEAGFIVGMSTCYPKPGSVKIAKDGILTLESNYSSEKSHTEVMGLFYLLVAESSSTLNARIQIHEESKPPIILWGVAVFGLAIFAADVFAY
ncbi:hypothetical protein CTI12_AA426450 [Artemisia annua]|uniref:Stress up-regulated Nod 19 n=1 Tax=Artemisia annua TaxID=35608 RepID=A0A2U1M2R7_ARTAN|nr:hypothetical protein CTI12_AA426450 [Artemisia annua]